MALKKQQTEEGQPLKTADQLAAELQGAAYGKSQAVQAADQQLADWEKQAPGAYSSPYQAQIGALLDKVLNRADFTYDFNADPLYQSYKDQYTRAGRLALQDTLASAAGLTGGYGSSYGVSAGSQAYQNELAGLNGRLPELYSAALDAYKANGAAWSDRLGALNDAEKTARAGYEETAADYYKRLSAYADAADSAYDRDYKAYQEAYDALADQRDYAAAQEQQRYKNDQSDREYALALQKYQESVRQWENAQAAAREKWQAQLGEDAQEFAQEMAYKRAKDAAAAAKSAAKTGSAARGAASSRSASAAGGSTAAKGDTADEAENRRQKNTYLQAARTAARRNGG
jgi:hypothetical protein